MEKKNPNSIYDGPQKGLFGETDRQNGEYFFRSGDVEQIYSNARYVPVDKSTEPPRYYKPAHQEISKRRKNGFGFIAILCLCLACALLGGIVGAMLMSSYFGQRVSNLEDSMGISEAGSVEMQAALIPSRNGRGPVPGEGSSDVTFQFDDSFAARDSMSADMPAEKMSASDIYDLACSQSVVINVEYVYTAANGIELPSVTSGSGFVIDSDGYILTNAHVVDMVISQGCRADVIFADETVYPARVVGYDNEEDIAVLKIDAAGLKPVTFGDSSEISVGDTIFAVGDPYGVLEFSMSTGHICALDRLVATTSYESGIKMFQIDASVYSGNSGGPVYDEYGRVVGIVTAKYADGEMDGIGFAVPVNDAKKSIEKILSRGFTVVNKGVSIGLSFDDRYTEVYSRYYRLPQGALVTDVAGDSCSEIAGIRPGDIIIEIDGYRLEDSSDVSGLLREYYPGDEVEVILYRQGEFYSTKLTFDAISQ